MEFLTERDFEVMEWTAGLVSNIWLVCTDASASNAVPVTEAIRDHVADWSQAEKLVAKAVCDIMEDLL